MEPRASKTDVGPPLGGLDSVSRRPASAVSELRLLRAIDELEGQLREVGDIYRAVRLAQRVAASLMGADDACVALLAPGQEGAVLLQPVPPGEPWDLKLLALFARGEKTAAPAEVAMARLKRHARAWGALALRWRASKPDWDIRNALTKIASAANLAIERIEQERLGEVRSRIDRKIMEQLRPKDLFYQILDGLRSLTGYDHSAILLAACEDPCVLEIAAEQIAWRKARSARVGQRAAVSREACAGLAAGVAWGFSRDGGSWEPWDAATPSSVVEWVRAGLPADDQSGPREAELIIAPLHLGAELGAVLRLSALHSGTFGTYEGDLVASFLPHAMVALQNARRAESLTDQVIQAQRKHAMADLARGVSHDVNNALGAILPLVQQMRDEAQAGKVDTGALAEDLAQVERSVQACSRIFGGMLRMARRGADTAGKAARVGAAVDGALSILGDGCKRLGIEIMRDVREGLPDVPLSQGELDQVLLNIVGNARDSMLDGGGELVIRAFNDDQGGVCIDVSDTGVGIPSDKLSRIFEPFYTTKPTGNGLGLSICRSIVWQAQGKIHVESPARTVRGAVNPQRAGPGSRFLVTLPAVRGR
jgi:two-component system, NtrC family, sensor kinase